jgi:hypothetical protein
MILKVDGILRKTAVGSGTATTTSSVNTFSFFLLPSGLLGAQIFGKSFFVFLKGE